MASAAQLADGQQLISAAHSGVVLLEQLADVDDHVDLVDPLITYYFQWHSSNSILAIVT